MVAGSGRRRDSPGGEFAGPGLSGVLADATAEALVGLHLLGLEEQGARVEQMFPHVALGFGGLAAADGVEDGLVKAQGVVAVDAFGGEHHHVEHGAMDDLEEAAEEAVAGGLENSAMEEEVGLDDVELIGSGSLDFGDGLAQDQELFGGGVAGCFFGQRGLDDEAGFDQLLLRSFVEQEEELHGLGEDGGGIVAEVGAVADALRDDAHHFEHLHDRPQRGAAYSEDEGEIALGGQLVTGS